MSNEAIDLLSVDRGAVTAPAGCGKTHLILRAVSNHAGKKPILVLTHTNAGVAALRARLNNSGINTSQYRLATLDGFAIRLVSSFPLRSGVSSGTLLLESPSQDYDKIRRAVCKLLDDGVLYDVLRASYSRLVVDEYQDCCNDQHAFISSIASVLPTCILGDPLQAVFSWLGLPCWDSVVCSCFPVVCELNTPWRWINAGAEGLGRWLLYVRSQLLQKNPIDFANAPDELEFVQLGNAEKSYRQQLLASRVRAANGGSILVIGNGKKPSEHRRFASQIPGAVTVENVSLQDLIDFAKKFDFNSSDALSDVLIFASKIMRNVNPVHVLKRIDSLESGRARVEASNAERAALAFKASPSPMAMIDLLVEIGRDEGVTSHRPSVLRACISSLHSCSLSGGRSFYDAAVCAREQNRILGRCLPRRAVGSPLLLKGLEGEVAVVLNAEDHDASALYVSMTRGSNKLVVCSYSPIWSHYV